MTPTLLEEDIEENDKEIAKITEKEEKPLSEETEYISIDEQIAIADKKLEEEFDND